MNKFSVSFEAQEEGGWSAWVPECPGVNTQGESIQEAFDMALEALAEMIEFRETKLV